MLTQQRTIRLDGLDGTNPLGFLAALGTLVTLHAAGETSTRLRWERTVTWTPVLEGPSTTDPSELSHLIATELRGKQIADDAEAARKQTQAAFDKAKKEAADKRKEITKRGLKGDARRQALAVELAPLEEAHDLRRSEWLDALTLAVPTPELALGKRIDPTVDEYRDIARQLRSTNSSDRRMPLDLLAAFASDGCQDRYGRTEATLFCFITGSGHQFFLDTVRELIERTTPDRVRHALFEPWAYGDEKLSLRWDPAEDNRYALAVGDPSDIGSHTVWMANLLAYRSLTLFPSVPRAAGLQTTSWSNYQDGTPAMTWPIWDADLAPDTIRSLLLLHEFSDARPDHSKLRTRGVVALYRAHRIKVGSGANFKVNFTPARALL